MAPEISLDRNLLIARGRTPCHGPWGCGENAWRLGLMGWGEALLKIIECTLLIMTM